MCHRQPAHHWTVRNISIRLRLIAPGLHISRKASALICTACLPHNSNLLFLKQHMCFTMGTVGHHDPSSPSANALMHFCFGKHHIMYSICARHYCGLASVMSGWWHIFATHHCVRRILMQAYLCHSPLRTEDPDAGLWLPDSAMTLLL